MWMRLLADYDYRATPASTVAYKAGGVYNAPSAAVDAAVACGKALRLRKANKDEEPTEWPSDPEPAASMPG
jgi:hypothetical protein